MNARSRFALVLTALAASVTQAGVSDRDAARDAWELRREAKWKVSEIFEALGLRSGQSTADIGCGDGFLTIRLAAAIGPAGKVFAVDIDDRALERLRKRLEKAGTKNVEVIKGEDADPLLGPASLASAVILRAYHEFSRHREMLTKIRAALRPGGRLGVADAGPADAGRGESRESQISRHVVAHSIVAKELTEAGYRVVLSRPDFVRLDNGQIVWLLAAERPPGMAGPI
jgi:ubiquinone/menaquinone biosynthesis C-methylase UbiE